MHTYAPVAVATHIGVPPLQRLPQQSAASPSVTVSQPLLKMPSQLPNPLRQVALHMPPALQLVLPLEKPVVQLTHAMPQCDASAVVSQPGVAEQSAKPELHAVYVHIPPAEQATPLACWTVIVQSAHVLPQWLTSAGVSQPFARLPSQSTKPVLHDV